MPSPCVGLCKAKDGLCLGCGRTLTEIGHWSAMDTKAQLAVMAELDGATAPEIAEALGIPLNTAYSRLRVARQRFADAARRLRRGEAR